MKKIKLFITISIIISALVLVSCQNPTNTNYEVYTPNTNNGNNTQDPNPTIDDEDDIVDFVPYNVIVNNNNYGKFRTLNFHIINFENNSNTIKFNYNGNDYEINKFKFDNKITNFQFNESTKFNIYKNNTYVGKCEISLHNNTILSFAFNGTDNYFIDNTINLQIDVPNETLIINVN